MTQETAVLVIFEHELLGEGLAARLQGMGIRALTVKSCDDDAIETALRTHPEVIVVECHNEGCLARIQRLSPTSRVVDASATVGRGYPTETLRFDVILDALGVEPHRETPA
jgi:hypothetical protein